MRIRRFALVFSILVVLAGTLFLVLADDKEPRPQGPKTPAEEKTTFQLASGFKIDLVACEPQVMDPVATCFDQDGKLYVAEMRGYPNDGYGTGNISSGCVKLLADRDGDGVYETATIFADGLRFPTSIQPWKKGILVSVAPDICFFEDTDGDGRADVKKTLYTGFGIDNIQQLLNSLQWGIDNWVYGCNGASGGSIRSVEKPDAPIVSLGSRGIRFHPETPGSLEPMSGGGQFGLSPDAWQHWFTATNSQHLRQIILPDHYLRRNPGMTVPATTLDIPEHGPACKVFRISPFEAWRVERTTRRKTGPDSARFAKTELIPGGFVTSACSPVVYEADLFPAEYRRSVFICEPANNLVLRDRLEEKGAIYTAKRADADREFLASTDNWFRPVNLSLGPDGCLYLVDFYREVIETPRSLPDDMKPKLVLRSQERGRIWRISYGGAKREPMPKWSEETSVNLVSQLSNANIWRRLTAQRLLVERQDKTVAPSLHDLVKNSSRDEGRAHALWTLQGLGEVSADDICSALKDSSPGVRQQGLRVAESWLNRSEPVRALAVKLADDPSAPVRFQAALSLGECDAPAAGEALGALLRKDADDPWITAAVLSSSSRAAPSLLQGVVADDRWAASAGGKAIIGRLGTMIGSRGRDEEIIGALALLKQIGKQPGWSSWQIALLNGLGLGMKNSPQPLHIWWDKGSPAISQALADIGHGFRAAEKKAESTAPLPQRVEAVGLISYAPTRDARSMLQRLLQPDQPPELQSAAVRALSPHRGAEVTEILLAAWPTASPSLRRELEEAIFGRREGIAPLLDAIEAKKILPQQLDASRIALLRKLPDKALRDRAAKLLAGSLNVDRQKVIESYKAILDLKSDAEKGRAVFRKHCIVCHRLENVGTEVGPDLNTALRDKTAEQLLISILDPSREVDKRFTNYLIETKSGRSLTGLIAAETAASITLRRSERAEDTVLRSQIDSITDTGKSLMPDGLEQQLTKQDAADLIAYLLSVK